MIATNQMRAAIPTRRLLQQEAHASAHRDLLVRATGAGGDARTWQSHLATFKLPSTAAAESESDGVPPARGMTADHESRLRFN